MNGLDELESVLSKLKVENSVKYKCAVCEDTGWIVSEVLPDVMKATARCNCLMNSMRTKRVKMLDEVFGQHEVKELRAYQRDVMSKLNSSKKKNLWLCGDTGIGKSALVYHRLCEFEFSFLAIRGVNISSLFREQLATGSWLKKSFDLKQYWLIAIDDIDKRWPFSEAMKNDIYDLIDNIVKSKIRLIVTANMNIDKFCSAWPEHQRDPLSRRLKNKCLEVE